MNSSHRAPHVFLRATFVIGALAFLAGAASPALADSVPLTPQTKIRLTIVQWMQSKGQYERWDALGGEYTVSDDGAVFLPFLGSLSVSNLDNTDLTSEIAKRLQEKIGLVQAPAVTIEILEYPPIYVVGDVTKPGEYKFRPGLTVLQSLALGGGPFRATSLQQSQTIKLAGELREIDHSLLRSTAKLARLQAEMTGVKEITFDRTLGVDQQYAAGIYNEERVIFQARANALDRQSKALTELRDLLNSEVGMLGEKVQGSEDNIKSIEDQLTSVKTLVTKGLTVSSRQLDLERLLTTYRSNRLDLVTAIMRGRQAISETTRNLEGLYDTRRSEVASELQSEQARLDQLKLKREMTQKLLLDDLAAGGGSNITDEALPLTFTVSRRSEGQIRQFQASETTALIPGDVVRVVRTPIADRVSQAAPADLPRETETRASQASQ
ncbi:MULTISPECIES: polysaccharide biosynthesis/export family protein [Rhizobium]|uniref:Polysaccharide biosynthesis/export family protein n=1 Tax=Rhizobium changzhiense TaxID=2692317 RepID=A0ABR6AEP1_9HYPH|nr:MULTISPECIES: polysaccharide biosynthesis/export family protein [Rhizobium]MBA5804964.1 polysaccharide biosynthesis/export family protein [Rhizobium changzhiense]MCH4550036.1 polysaccharide biosynthesis/export family protein [Rhizobium changzhiense]MCV9947181.1 polysaccharide biosynthesis/export family protein [Rhizobium sp. BT-175]MCW0021058.1 polysaccharide biosynthesis/export family protein [Rhizobium sp. BT-226]NNU51116.1 exopolysaccharide biosynthesis protein [Rhizobium changzhiense]